MMATSAASQSDSRLQTRALYQASSFPVFQNRVFDSAEEARQCARGDVFLVQDESSGLIHNRAFCPDAIVYDANYHNEQALSAAFRAHLESVAGIIRKHFANSALIEVGCGKAWFLEMLQGSGFVITGIDPAYDGSNPAILKRHFTPDSGLSGDGIILRHVLEHIQNPVAFLSAIAEANGRRGKIYIEVPCFDWICRHRTWFDIFYEHVNYFRLADFDRIFGTVHESGRIFGGQYLYVVADLSSLRTPPYPVDRASRARGNHVPFEFPDRFLEGVDHWAARLTASPGPPPVIWGGASKGVIFALFMERAGIRIDFAIDINPAKQNKFLPATGLQVKSPADGVATLSPGAEILVMNGNYLDEVKDLAGNRFNCIALDQ